MITDTSMTLLNLHTHDKTMNADEINILDFPANTDIPQSYFSVSLHPWYLDQNKLDLTEKFIIQHNSDKYLIALGECGLDKLCPTPIDLQRKAFRLMIALSEKYKKPLIIHCVKAFDELVATKKEINPKQCWIIHGFRGNPIQGLQLIKQGFYLSFGPKHNSETIKVIPLGAIFAETDDSRCQISDVYRLISSELNISADTLSRSILNNATKYLNITI